MGPARRKLLTVLQDVAWLVRYPGALWAAARTGPVPTVDGLRAARNAARTYVARKVLLRKTQSN
jgi:hypothetical protein